MDKVLICHTCGRTVESAFVYCPWCGIALDADSHISDRIDSVFLQIESMQKEFTENRINRMENELGELEQALTHLLSHSHHL